MSYNEPWKVSKHNFILCNDGYALEGTSLLFPSDRNRIVACVNFCAGVSNEELEKLDLKELINNRESCQRGLHAFMPPMQQPRPILPPAFLEALRSAAVAEINYMLAKADPNFPCHKELLLACEAWSAVETANREEVR
jgi:hypothetical protein